MFVILYIILLRMTFGVDPDSHIDTVEQSKSSTIEGTSKWSCKLSITGTRVISHKQILFLKIQISQIFTANIILTLDFFYFGWKDSINQNDYEKISENSKIEKFDPFYRN